MRSLLSREPEHRIFAYLPGVELGNSSGWKSMEIEVRRANKPLGRLLIGRGGIEFRAPSQKKKGKKITWLELAKMLHEVSK